MSDCCRAAPCEEVFGSRTAEGDLHEYLSHGLGTIETRMLDAIPPLVVAGARRVLEIGGGVGALQAELVLKGASSGEVIELVGAYEPYARRLATKLGIGDRTSFRVADVIENPQQVQDADIVVMNRVVCCSPDGLRLTAVAAGLTRQVLAISYPRSLAILRLMQRLQEPFARLFRRRYRFYIHDARAIRTAATAAGMSLQAAGHGAFWEYAVFAMPGSPMAPAATRAPGERSSP